VRRRVWAVVPAKCPARAKSRLRPVLRDAERARFARGLLEHVLGVLATPGLLDGVLVATDCDEVARLARRRGAATRGDRGARSLAAVVDAALADVGSHGAGAALVLMADLPRLAAADVRAVLAALEAHDVVVVPDHLGRHTNALALAPPTALATRFGREDSFSAHCAAARSAGLRLAVLQNERVAFDVDGPADHARLLAGVDADVTRGAAGT